MKYCHGQVQLMLAPCSSSQHCHHLCISNSAQHCHHQPTCHHRIAMMYQHAMTTLQSLSASHHITAAVWAQDA
eukprot:6012916-Lingulodinium_polyedra.AAC.1